MMMAGDASKKLNVVQLGFSVAFEDSDHKNFAGHHLPRWRDWDGGQIGGQPSWLQPRDIPKDPLLCQECQEPLSFICQLYAPADDVSKQAFHRSLYVFGCPNIQCAKSTTGSIRVLRTQLPKENPFYPDEDDETWAMHLPEAWDVKLCQVCSQRGHGKCPIQELEFCGKHHQKEYKKYIFDKQQQFSRSVDFTFLPSVYADSELAVEDEPNQIISQAEMDEKADKALFGKSTGDDDDDDDDDKDLEQDDLNKMVGARESTVTKDSTTMAFFARLVDKPNVQEQCLRYLRWPDKTASLEDGAPLWIRQDYQPTSIPECPYCGAERKFEFQLMPQMLHYLLKDHQIQRAQNQIKQHIKTEDMKNAIEKASSIIEQAPKEHIPPAFAEAKEKAVEAVRTQLMEGNNELSWGVVAIYTCTASCGELQVEEGSEFGAYREEFAWKQPSLD